MANWNREFNAVALNALLSVSATSIVTLQVGLTLPGSNGLKSFINALSLRQDLFQKPRTLFVSKYHDGRRSLGYFPEIRKTDKLPPNQANTIDSLCKSSWADWSEIAQKCKCVCFVYLRLLSWQSRTPIWKFVLVLAETGSMGYCSNHAVSTKLDPLN